MPEEVYDAESRGVSLLTGSPLLPVEFVNRPAHLVTITRELSGSSAVGLDTESNNFYRYPEQLCLVQIASRHKVYLIDTLSLDDLTPLWDILENAGINKIIHAADNDIRTLDRHYGIHVRNLFDTSLAARFTGITRLSLGALTGDLLNISMNKSKRLQRADWGRRPLSAEALEYAADDVRYLHALREVLGSRLDALGRATWVAEECTRLEEIRYTAPDNGDAYLFLKGSKGLDERGLAVLRSLYLFREKEALRQHRPPFRVLPDATLVLLAAGPETDLSEVSGLGPTGLKRFGKGLRQALHEGMSAPPVQRPRPAKAVHPGKEKLRRLNRLKEWRISLGESLSLDPSLLWPLPSLERLAGAPESLDAELASDEVRHWQQDAIAPSLRACLNSLK